MNYEILSKLTQEATPQTLCYIELRRKYRNYSAQQSEIFLAEYRQTIGSLDELISKCDSLVDKYLSAGIDFALSDVVGLEIYDVSKDEFRSKYFTRYDTWKRDFKPIRDRHDAITLSVDELSKKREEEKNRSSGGVIGGGFGLEGAAKGIAYGELDAAQQAQLWRLIEEYARDLQPELAQVQLDRIRAAELAKVHFAWAGGRGKGDGHYYRIHGPTFVIELDNTQNDANHVHTVWRDLTRDFGQDLLREHYQQQPHGK